MFGLLAGGAFTLSLMVALDMKVTHIPLQLSLACLVLSPALAALAGLVPARRVAQDPVTVVLQAE